ncbi:pilus assembly protein [Xanthomonas sp. CFBP 8703]|uniref:Pilus assembly protein n=1 Tax=Xanthomonas bonasiae TaxID=2810351 RepID=A0ABS3AXI5_9XANT|nr:pilus assembly protein [Xanthomonas bonasiae]MBN6101089.1 pilus assembly protein [Xanthomonas bonasiae]
MTSRAKNATRKDSFLAVAAGLLIGTIGSAGADVDVSQSPLYVGSTVPGNLAIVPSVEFPTVISKANLSDTYSATSKFVGYFDSKKCYKYNYSTTETDRYFYPVSSLGSSPTNYSCAGTQGAWSGNFLNWAATQTIDPFRSALTGGYRVRDTATETILEKAVADRASTQNFPRRVITNNATLITGGTSATWQNLNMRIDGLGNKMRFSYGATTDTVVAYDPSVHALNGSYLNPNGTACTAQGNRGCVLDTTLTFEVSVRVKVCVSGFLEDNCVAYPNGGYKPEGLIQQYATRIRYSIFGYKNIDNNGVDTGILRAKQKFVGPYSYNPDQGRLANTAREWDPQTGILYQNPDSADADATTAVIGNGYPIVNSGVINYLNKFGQLNTGKNVKSYDDVSELYYAAIRYFKHQGNVAAYSALSGDSLSKYRQADGFPVITSWNDPISYRCQVNVILGIGDTNTHNDKNLPGNTANLNGEPTQPAEVSSDKSVNVITRMTQIWRKEGQNAANAATKASASQFNGDGNSAYIAALAYDAHTKDMRPDTASDGFPGKQTLSTHWVDVVEYGDYKSPSTNQYWLTAKYGGFQVPEGYDPDTNLDALADGTWWNGTSYVNGNNTYKQPDNYYIAADAEKMIASLRKAFERILDEMKGSAASLASNTTKLESGARTYQSVFYSGTWRGDLIAYNVNQTTGALTQAWSASGQFPAWNARTIKFASGATTLSNFAYGNLTSTPLSSATQQQIDYLRGDRTNEKANGGALRTRTGLMGDIVNSQPVYVGSPNARLYTTATFTGASAYASFAAAKATRTPMLYVGANDGMLHGFNASSGAETFAFVPKAAMTGLLNYTSPDYEHRYYVDGELTVSDIYDTATASWRSILIGTMGRGGKGMFALDVTDPDNISLLWDKTSTDLTTLGNNLGKPIIGQLGNGQWYAMVGNGPNSSGDSADLVLVNILSGVSSDISTGATGDNGLSSVLAWSSNNDYIVDRIYAGDLNGNLWRFDMTGASGTATRLFTAQYGSKTQPITAAPTAAKDPSTGLTWVFFGTGKYLSDGDLSNKDVQTWYGLIDRGRAIASDRSSLNKVDIEQQGTVNGYTVRVIEDQPSPGLDGWYMDLVPPSGTAQGERMVVSNFFQGTALIGTTRIPDSGDVCSPSGKGFVMAINPFTGGRMPQSFFDLDGSGGSSTGDTLNGKPASGIGLDSSPNSPIFIGNQMQIGLDNASTVGIGTNSSALSMKRVSWRELLRND